MDIIRCEQDAQNISGNNKILGKPAYENAQITFNGKNNILYCDDGIRLGSSKISFNASNSLVYLSANRHSYNINLSLFNNSSCFIGKNCYFNGCTNIAIAEERNVFIGEECMFSFGIWVRTADPHLVYSTVDYKRKNMSKSVFIGDHVWIGQNALVLKGSQISSGSILSGGGVLTGKAVASNVVWGGNPAKLVSSDIFWLKDCVNGYTAEATEKSMLKKDDTYIYVENTAEKISFADIDKKLLNAKSADEMLKLLKAIPTSKNRFATSPPKQKHKLFK